MNRIRKMKGFSLAEMLIATGIMAIGLVMIATIFPVGVKLTTLTTERTVSAVVADEAFAKIQLYGLRDFVNWPVSQIALNGGATIAQAEALTETNCTEFIFALKGNLEAGTDAIYRTMDDSFRWPGLDGSFGTGDDILDSGYNLLDNFIYPSTVSASAYDRNYYWSALCRRVGPKDVQVTVFVSRKIAAGAQYRSWDYTPATTSYSANPNGVWPVPVPISVTYNSAFPMQVGIDTTVNPQNIMGFQSFIVSDIPYFFDDGFTIVDDLTGKIYRVLEVDHTTGVLTLREEWQWVGYPILPAVLPYTENRTIWVVPPAVGSDRYPCVGVYQKIIRFDAIN